MKVKVSDPHRILGSFRARLLRLVRLAAPREWAGGELSLAVVEGCEMADLNSRFTGRSGETDVLAFPLADGPSAGKLLVGEIVVNASLAAREARQRGVRPIHELALYALHGTLHLAGSDDHAPDARKAMYARERELCRRAGIPCTRARRKRRPRANER